MGLIIKQWKGTRNVVKRIRGYGDGVVVASSTTNAKFAREILNVAVVKAPRDKGDLQNSGAVRSLNKTDFTVVFTDEAAIPQEFGTRFVSPKLFLTSTVEGFRSAWFNSLFEGMKNA